ncbi:MFS transporter, partial [Azonexus hydrophilus]
MFRTLHSQAIWAITLAAAGILMVTMGIRQSFGLFIAPIDETTGLGVVAISFALAVGQFTWGAIQPVAGAVADRYGPRPVLLSALLVLAVGCAATPFVGSGFGLVLTLGVLAAAGSGAGSFSVLIGAAAQHLPLESRGTASGVINAGGSFGQFIFAPITQKLIQGIGWMGSLWAMALAALATLPLVFRLTARQPAVSPGHAGDQGLRHAIADALKDRSYLLLHAG